MPNDQNQPLDKAPGSARRGRGIAPEDLEAQVTDDIGGVQGEAPADDAEPQAPDPTAPDPTAPDPTAIETPPEEPAPDAGEIEWAGQLVKKPPALIG